MDTLAYILVFSLLGGVLSVIAAAVFLAFPERVRDRAIPHFVSFAIGGHGMGQQGQEGRA